MMTLKNLSGVFFILIVLNSLSCKEANKPVQTEDQQPTVFPKGEKIVSDHFTGTAWLQWLVTPDSLNNNSVGSVTFEPGARTNWHSHPTGQIILSIAGTGYYQEKGSAKRILNKGDAVKCPPNILHWHGASPDSQFIQVAISSRTSEPVEWMEPVTDQEYNQ